jgi:hypothetical protein
MVGSKAENALSHENGVSQEAVLPPPRAPLESWPIQIQDPEGRFYLWWTQDACLVTQLHAEFVSLKIAQRLVEAIEASREAHRDEIEAAGGILSVHDWSQARTVDVEARSYFAQSFRKNTKRGDVRAGYIALPMNPLLRMTLNIVNISARIASGSTIRLVPDIGKTLKRFGIQPPPA